MNVSRFQHAFGNGILQIIRLVQRAPRTLCWLAALYVLDFLLFPVVDWINANEEFTISVMLGAIVGQCVVVAILGSLYGTTWIDGFILSGFIVVIGVMLFVFGTEVVNEGPPDDFWVVFGMVPGITFAVFAPLLVMRHFSNWRLVEPGRVYPKQPTGLTSIFLNTTAIAAILILLRMPQMVWEVPVTQFWPWSLVVGVIIVLVSTAVTVPLAKFVLNCDARWQRLIRLVAAAITAYVIFVVGLTVIGEVIRQPMPDEFYGCSLLAAAAAIFVAHTGISAIRADGFRLRTSTNDLADSTLPKTEEQKAYAQAYLHQHARRIRWQVIAMVVLTVGLNTYVNATQSRKARFDRNIAELQNQLDALGCQYTTHRNHTVGIRYSRSNIKNQNDLSRISEVRNVFQRMQLQKALTELDFSDSDVYDSTLRHWRGFDNVKTLDVSRTNVRAEKLYNNWQRVPLLHLRAMDLDLSAAKWDAFNTSALESLWLDKSTIDPDEFATFLDKCKLKQISLVDVQLSDKLVEALIAQTKRDAETLILAGTTIDDSFVREASLDGCQEIDLSFTNIGDQSCEFLRQASPLGSLILEGTAVTDQGVAKLKDVEIVHLDVSNTGVTNNAFDGWTSLPSALVLAETKVDDGFADVLLRHQESKQGMSILDLRKTHVTAAVLPVFSQVTCRIVDITDTAITGKELLDCVEKHGGLFVSTWRVGAKQFSRSELKKLELVGVEVELAAQ